VACLALRRSATRPGARLSAIDSPLERGSASRGRPGSVMQCSADQAPDSLPYSEGPAAMAALPESRRQPCAGSSSLPGCCHCKVAAPWNARVGAFIWNEDKYCEKQVFTISKVSHPKFHLTPKPNTSNFLFTAYSNLIPPISYSQLVLPGGYINKLYIYTYIYEISFS
jgi:hypothetical protein